MLDSSVVNAVIPTHDVERSRKFYESALGCRMTEEYPGNGFRYECADGSWFLLYETTVPIPAQHTVAGWTVEDIEAVVAELESNGVTFEVYDMAEYGFPEAGKAKILDMDGAKGAFFKDPEGNILSLFQAPA
jgi:catechol 2,3-dioxygenase-like lactoylglutathione lyase family enzyme